MRRRKKVKQKEHRGREEIFDIISSYQQWSLNIVLHYCTATDTQRNENLKTNQPQHITFSHILGRTGGDYLTAFYFKSFFAFENETGEGRHGLEPSH